MSNPATEPKTLSIAWAERVVKVSELKPYERNPRQISKEDFFKLKKSLKETGYHSPILAQPDLRIIGGHMRIRALKELGIVEIAVRVPERTLTDEEFKRVMIQHNLSFGQFDTEMLSSDFDKEELIDWGMSEKLLDEGAGSAGASEDLSAAEPEDPKDMVTCPNCNHSFPVKLEIKK